MPVASSGISPAPGISYRTGISSGFKGISAGPGISSFGAGGALSGQNLLADDGTALHADDDTQLQVDQGAPPGFVFGVDGFGTGAF